jgi:hypothetical protein
MPKRNYYVIFSPRKDWNSRFNVGIKQMFKKIIT